MSRSLLTTKEAAEELRISTRTLYEWRIKGKVAARGAGPGTRAKRYDFKEIKKVFKKDAGNN